MYPSTTLFIAFGQLAIVVLVMFSYPLQVHPCRNCLDKVFSGAVVVKPAPAPDAENEDEDDHAAPTHVMSTTKFVALTAGIVASGYAIAYVVNDLQMGCVLFSIPLSSSVWPRG